MSRSLRPLPVQLLLLLLLLAVSATVYAPGLHGPLLLDDFPQLGALMESGNRDWDALLRGHLFSNSGHFSRPVSMASFIVNARLHGDDVFAWKATNLLIHLLTAVTVFFLARALLQAAWPAERRHRAGWLALLLAGLWLLHALHVSTVLYTVQRMTQLATLFCFAGLLAYVQGRLRQLHAAAGGWLWIGVAWLVCLPLAVLSKENGVLLLLFIPLVEWVLIHRVNSRSSAARLAVPVLVTVPALLAGIYLLLHFDALVLDGYYAREFTLTERLLTQSRVLVMYLMQLLVPVPLLLGFYHDDIEVSHGLLAPVSTAGSLLLLAGLLWLAWRARRDQPLITLGILFFFAAHVLESGMIPLELMFEHRNYMASFGILLVLVVALEQLISAPRVLAAAGIALLFVWTGLTTARAGIWSSQPVLLQHMYTVHSNSKRLTTVFANRYADSGNYQQALALLDRFDDPAFRLNRLYVLCQRDGRIADTEMVAATAAMQGVVNSHAMTGLIRVANLGLDGTCTFSERRFLALMDRAAAGRIRATPRQKLHMYRAHYLHRLDGVDAALPALELAFGAEADNPVPLFLATEWLLDAGRISDARQYHDRALQVARNAHRDYSAFITALGERLSAGTGP